MIPGHATAEATAEYFNSRAELGGWLEAGLHCSHVGFGGYRVDDRSPVQAEALKTALLSGCNLIDTSSNYTDGGSERAVGKALAELIRVGVLDREQVVLVSKLGYVQGQALALAQEREASGQPFAEMVKYMQGCWHCIHPDFLAVQLQKSLERLDVECLDFCLLHNPEYFMMDAAKRGAPFRVSELRQEFYDRVRRAFVFFEEQVAAGKLQGYGVSSNTLGAPGDRPDATSLSLFWEAARAASQEKNGAPEKHHFHVAQLPMNLYETGPYFVKNTGPSDSQTALEFAAKQRIAILVNRPLNAFTQQQMVRLSDFSQNAGVGSIDTLLEQLALLEGEFAVKIAPGIQTGGGVSASDLFRWTQDLAQVKDLPLGADRWSQVEEQISQHVTELCDQLSTQLQQGPWAEWQNRYLPKLRSCLAALRDAANRRSQENSDALSAKIDPFLPEEWRKTSLSQKALGILIHTPGVSCVLNGMRKPAYVHDSMGAVPLKPLPEAVVKQIYAALK